MIPLIKNNYHCRFWKGGVNFWPQLYIEVLWYCRHCTMVTPQFFLVGISCFLLTCVSLCPQVCWWCRPFHHLPPRVWPPRRSSPDPASRAASCSAAGAWSPPETRRPRCCHPSIMTALSFQRRISLSPFTTSPSRQVKTSHQALRVRTGERCWVKTIQACSITN